MPLRYEKLSRIALKTDPAFNEKWVQDRISEDPSILLLGDVVLKDRERSQPRAGRLDLLLQTADGNRRFEVEVQLGRSDESHIIRSLEYWDIERKRYPQYDHTAVIVAEEITSRFLNVISLFNGTVPIVAIQMTAVQIGEVVSLIFVKVLDQVQLGLVDEDEEIQEPKDRTYWENQGSKDTVAAVDRLLDLLKEIDATLELKYNKYYVGLARQGRSNNFVIFKPQKRALVVEVTLDQQDDIRAKIDQSNLEMLDYDSRYRRYRIRLNTEDIDANAELLKEIFTLAYNEYYV